MRAVALDIGDVRTGIAATGASATLASPVCVLATHELRDGAPSWKRVLEDYEPEMLIFGRPSTLAGDIGSQAEHVAELAEQIAEAADLPFEFVDERLSSTEAKRILREQGLTEREMRGKIDMVAASLFLETWLDACGCGEETA